MIYINFIEYTTIQLMKSLAIILLLISITYSLRYAGETHDLHTADNATAAPSDNKSKSIGEKVKD